MLKQPATLMIGFAALTFVVAGLSLIAYNMALARTRLAQRVAKFCGIYAAAGRMETAVEQGTGVFAAGVRLQGHQLEIARRFGRLGVLPDHAVAAFVLLRVAVACVIAAAAFLFARVFTGLTALPQLDGIALCGGGLGWFLPQMALSRLIAQRKRAIARGLPDAIELLVIAVEAGLALEDGIDRIVVEMRPSQPEIAEELALTSADLKILPSRDVALRRLWERSEVPSLRSVVTTLSQTMRYGTPLAQALRVVAAELRNDALIRLEERANRMPALLTVPMIIFILPSIFLVIGGPAFLHLIDTFFH